MKKGLSEIITTVFLIMLALVVVTIIFSFGKDFIQKQSEKTIGYSPYYDAKIKDVQISPIGSIPTGPSSSSIPITEKIIINLERIDNEGNVSGVSFTFYDDSGNSYSYEIKNNPPNIPGFIETYEITNTDLKIENFSKIKKVSVRILYGKGNPTNVLDEYEIN